MNPALTAAMIAASQREEGEQDIEGRLRAAKAVSVSSAVALKLGDKGLELLDQAISQGTVKRTANGRLYLNEQRISDRNEGQIFLALLILLGTASIIVSVVVLVQQMRG